MSQECRWPPEVGKGKVMLSLTPSRMNAALSIFKPFKTNFRLLAS